MENYHDAVRHLRYLRQSLSQDNEPIGFFLSAGCPLSVRMPEGKWPLIPDVANLTKYINSELEEDKGYGVLLAEMKKADKNTSNIEETLSFVRSLLVVSGGGDVRGLSGGTLEGLEKSICKAILDRLNVQLPTDETPYHNLCKWIRSIDRKVAVEVFTTNYDLLLEQSLEELGVPYFDGFVGSRRSFFDLRAIEDDLIPSHWSRLWKIHGSINWYQEKTDHGIQVHRSSELKKDASHLIYPSHLKYEESRKMPYLAMMDQLNRFIRRKSSLLILSGYSFNDKHVNDTIVNALTANPTAMVLGLLHGNYANQGSNGEAADAYPEAYRLAKKQHNLNLWTFDKAIIGTNLGAWTRRTEKEDADPDLENFVVAANTSGTTTYSIRLGDFAVATSFLQKIIGTSRDGQYVK